MSVGSVDMCYLGNRFLREKLLKRESDFEPTQFTVGHKINKNTRLQFHILVSTELNKNREFADKGVRLNGT